MSAPLIVVPLAIELTILITTFAPLTFRNRFTNQPNLGISLWLLSFLAAFVSTLIALAVAIWSIFDTWHELESHSQPLWHTLLFSFAPWVVLGLAGISMAIFVQKLEPVREQSQMEASYRNLPSKGLADFQSVEVREIDLPVRLAFTVGNGKSGTIFLSSEVSRMLSKDELEALLWHELAHAKFRHNAIKSLVKIIRHLGGVVLASRVLASEVDRLCELAADNYARRRVSPEVLASARSSFN